MKKFWKIFCKADHSLLSEEYTSLKEANEAAEKMAEEHPEQIFVLMEAVYLVETKPISTALVDPNKKRDTM